MSSVETLNSQFGIPGVATIDAGRNGMPRIRVTSPAAEAEIYLHGAHITQFTPKGHKPVLFMSGESLFDPAKPIRGGVPLIFPWFGPNLTDASAPAHGFARTNPWTIRGIRAGADAKTEIELALGPSAATRTHWPHDFEATFTIGVGKTLDMALEIVSRAPAEVTFEEAFHTYLVVGDIRQTTIEGLAGRTFIDKVDHAARKTQPAGAMSIAGETDRVYLNSQDVVTVHDKANGRTITIGKSGSLSTVVWNPWINKSKAMADFGDDEWPGMLCIETANAADNAVKLVPGGRHKMTSTIAVS